MNRLLQFQNHIKSYPSFLFFNDTSSHKYSGPIAWKPLMDFIDDVLNPKVVVLDSSSFPHAIDNGKWWLVDFFAPWCAPCQTLSVAWRRVAKMFASKEKLIQVGSVDCEAHKELCRQHHVRGYPTIRLYHGSQANWEYSGFHRDADFIYRWAFDFLPSNVRLVKERFFRSNIINSAEPWLLDYYAPWCGPCHKLAPIFAELETLLPGVRLGKVNCDDSSKLCEEAQVDGFPTIMLYPGHNRKVIEVELRRFNRDEIANAVRSLLKTKHTEL